MESINNETWKPLVGYDGLYEISDKGNVKSLPAIKNKKSSARERILSLAQAPNGYSRVLVYNKTGRKLISVHRQVALSFIPNPENKPTVNHKNGIKTDNRVENLEWATHKENIAHAYETGLTKVRIGEDVGNSKLTRHDAMKIKRLYGTGIVTQRQIADYYGVTVGAINHLLLNKTWRAAA